MDARAAATATEYRSGSRQPRPEPLPCRSDAGPAGGAVPAGRSRATPDAASRPPGRAGRRAAGRAGRAGRPQPAGPAPAAPLRRGRRLDREAPRLPRNGATGVRRARPGRAVASRRRARLAHAHAARRQIPAHLPVRAGRVRPDVPGQHDRQPDPLAAQVRRSGAGGALPAGADQPGPRCPVPGRDVHDRASGRLGCRRDRGARDGGGGRHLAVARRQVVLLERRCRPGDGAGAAGRRAAGHTRAEPVPAASGAAGRAAQRLSDRAVEGQARHAVDGERRDHACKARPRSWSASLAPGSARWRT